MILLIAALAHVGPAHAGLRADLDREGQAGADLTVVCSSAGQAVARIRTLAAALHDQDDDAPAGLPAGLEGVGGLADPEGPLVMDVWPDIDASRLGFVTALPAEALARRYAALAAGREVFEGPTGWGVRDGAGHEVTLGTREGRGWITEGTPPPDAHRVLSAALLGAVPEEPGCALLVHVSDEKLGEADAVVHLSLDGGRPATFALSAAAITTSDTVLLTPVAPPEVHTPDAPEAVLVLGLGLDGVDFSTLLQGKELRQARRAQNVFPVTAGTTVALLARGPTLRAAAVLPFAGHLTARQITRRAVRLAKASDVDATRLDPTHFVLRDAKMTVYGATTSGRLYLATEAGTLNAIQLGVGPAWVGPDLATLAAHYPLVLAAGTLPGGTGHADRRLPRPAVLALDLDGNLVRGILDVPLSLDELGELFDAVEAARAKPPGATAPPEMVP